MDELRLQLQDSEHGHNYKTGEGGNLTSDETLPLAA